MEILLLLWLIPLASLIATITYRRRTSRRQNPRSDTTAIIQAIYTSMGIEITALASLLCVIITLLLKLL